MRPSSDAAHRLLLASLLACSPGCSPKVELSLQLQPAFDAQTGVAFDTSELKRLVVISSHGSAAGDVERIEFALDRARQQELPPLRVGNAVSVQIDVWGCPAPDTCEAGDVSFFGCTAEPLDLSEAEEAQPVLILLHPRGDPRVQACPGRP